jgi:hypothetical protein
MSEQYKQYIDDLCNKADNGNTKAVKELLDEANKWSAKNKQLIKERDNKKDK